MKNCFDRTPHTMKDWLLLAAGVAAVFAAADWLPGVLRGAGAFLGLLAPFGWGLLLAYVLDIPTRFFAQKLFGGRRGGAMAVSYALFFGALALLAALVVPQLVQSVTTFAGRLGAYEETIRGLLPPAFTIAMLGAIESLLSATVADGVTGDRHNSNTELIAQGAANIVVPFFGGIPVTGAIARTMTNINNGGRTPVAGIIHAVVLLLILLFLSPLTRHIPMACLAGVLVIVSYNMSEWRTIRGMMKNPKADIAVLFTTLLLTVVFDLTIAIAAGLLMAVVLFMRRIMESTNISVIHDQIDMTADAESNHRDDKVEVAEGVEVYEIDGPFFFGIASKFDDVMHTMGEKSKVRIIRMRKVPFIDSTGLHNLSNLIRASRKEGIEVILSGVNPSVRETLLKAGIDRLVGEENICANIHIAAERANRLVAGKTA